MKLAPGQFFGHVFYRRGGDGLTVNLARYQANQVQPFHVHAHPTFFALLQGLHCDQTRNCALEQQELSLAFHGTDKPHASAVGPRGMVGMNLEYEPGWLERHGIQERDLVNYRMLEPTVWSRLAILHLVCTAIQPSLGAEDDLHADGLELLEPLIEKAPTLAPTTPPWMRRAEEFLHAHFRAYLRALRLVDAGALVLCRGESLASAAVTAGFADQAHLTRCFARQFGFTPRAVRVARDELQP
jgi:hypothetical protein